MTSNTLIVYGDEKYSIKLDNKFLYINENKLKIKDLSDVTDVKNQINFLFDVSLSLFNKINLRLKMIIADVIGSLTTAKFLGYNIDKLYTISMNTENILGIVSENISVVLDYDKYGEDPYTKYKYIYRKFVTKF